VSRMTWRERAARRAASVAFERRERERMKLPPQGRPAATERPRQRLAIDAELRRLLDQGNSPETAEWLSRGGKELLHRGAMQRQAQRRGLARRKGSTATDG